MAVLVLIEINGVLGADVHAGVGDAALAAVRDADLLGRAGIAGEGNDIDQGLLEVLLVRGGLLDLGADRGLLTGGLQAHAQGQTDPLLHDGPLQKHVVAMLCHLAGNDLVGDHIHPVQIAALIGKTGYLGKDIPADIIHRAVYTSHSPFSSCSTGSRILSGFVKNSRNYYIRGGGLLQGKPPGNQKNVRSL